MSKNELFTIPEDALKQIKKQGEFESYFQKLYRQGVEALLKAETYEHPGYPKHNPSGKNGGNNHYGSSRQTLKPNMNLFQELINQI